MQKELAPTPMCSGWEISWLKYFLSPGARVSIPPRNLQTRTKEPASQLVVKISGDSVHLGEKGVCWRPRCCLPGVEHSCCYSASLESALPGSPASDNTNLPVMTQFCHTQILQKGLQAVPSRKLWGALFLFLEKFLAEIQTVTELCSFGKRTIPFHIKYTASTAPTPDFCVQESEGQMLGCVTTLVKEWGKLLSPTWTQPKLFQKGEEVPTFLLQASGQYSL